MNAAFDTLEKEKSAILPPFLTRSELNELLDAWNRCHDVKNLLVVDAACFVSHPEKSITLTIMALATRASEHLAEDLRLGHV